MVVFKPYDIRLFIRYWQFAFGQAINRHSLAGIRSCLYFRHCMVGQKNESEILKLEKGIKK